MNSTFNETDDDPPPSIIAPMLGLDPIARLMFHAASVVINSTTAPSSASPEEVVDPLQLLIDKINQAQQEECDSIANSCENRPLYTWLVGYGFIFVFLLALFGNVVNLLIYNSDHIKYYIAIRMLCTRLLMNSLTLICMLPQALRIISAWEIESRFEEIYWIYYPYQIYFVNLFGFCAMWLTVLMTAECYLHVFFPSHSKSLCTKRNLSRSYMIIISVGALLALMYKFNRSVSMSTHCNRVIPTIHASEDFIMICLEKLHTFANLILAIVVPMGLLLFMASSILWKLVLKKTEFVTHFTAEKRCVTRITLITTGLQLVAELPPIPVFLYATIFGPGVTNEPAICVWNTIAVFLGLCNVSLSFFVYLVFSDKFREMVKTRLTELVPCCSTPRSLVHYSNESSDPKLRTNLLAREQIRIKPSETESSVCTETYLLNEKSSTNDDSFL
ncbi:Protein CBG00409 [Caenorhabditis briggsae]|uniref:G-protein coupled receptors family 1 profile domain-containing protein n=2 Tax=Caenorhabditis briggsae TaxID=6238 RepID=A0AAE9ESG6_CAEBR|nr:Protein CBG00409 [Caenorhabditis briggsae]ULT92969.1 hypothetical protein L3Y34_002862 [Caenorhabditis briggsae]UMM26226.1 hypothetical protein L5515_010021 [Caenorhabditis briggsae]CAP21864.2 Protein CBG00409 [Caenorhabditis briggsae]